MLFDTHVHFDTIQADGNLSAVLDTARAADVHRFLAVGGRPDGNSLGAELAASYPDRIWAAVGYDRDLATTPPPLETLRTLLTRPGVVAVGETGLDYFYSPETAEQQRGLFRDMLALARETRRPVIVHSREADGDTLQLLAEHATQWPGDPGRLGVLHCFTGNAAFAQEVLKLGLHISFSGILTFRNADPLRAVARDIPDDRLLVETDTPYLTPVPHRGQPNQPAWVRPVAEKLAEVRGVAFEHIAHTTTQNACRLFGLAS